MAFFQSKRDAQMQALVAELEQKIADLSKRPEHLLCRVPAEHEMADYWKKISELNESEYFVFYLARLRMSVANEFECSGKEYAEFYRGQLALIGKIVDDARMAKKQAAMAEAIAE